MNQGSYFDLRLAPTTNIGVKGCSYLTWMFSLSLTSKFRLARLIFFFAEADALMYAGCVISSYRENTLCFGNYYYYSYYIGYLATVLRLL